MKKLLLSLGICLVIAAASLAVVLKAQLSRRVISLHNGQTITADRAWEAAGDLYYTNGEDVRVARLADVRAIEPLGIVRALQAVGTGVTGRLNAGWVAFAPRHLSSTGWIILASVTATAFLYIGRRRSRRRSPLAQPPTPVLNPGETCIELPNESDVVRFFLNMFRQHVGAGIETTVEFTQLTTAAAGSNKVYELRLKQAGDWVRRRMTVGSLGDEISRKSRCYFVIFDKHMVVKVPPKPIRDFEEYVVSIQKEGRIVERLAPKECIIPKVSVILSQVHPLPSDTETSPRQLEEKYLSWLRQNPNHQSCLKIKGTFVYFMDLSRYYFLSHIMDGFRNLDEILRAEYTSASELAHYPSRFRERYGDENEAVGFEIRELYHQCEADIRQMLTRSGKPSAATDSRVQSWFVSFLRKKEIDESDTGLSPELVNGLTSIFTRWFEKYRESVKAYTRLIDSFAQQLSLEQNRLPIAGIITHLLDLLAWLDVKKMAMRDLKPDNILVAGDAQHYPAFLRSPADYSLGFIDVETAVCLDQSGENGIRQPLLGGTPCYATPSHLFPNSILEACFGDAPRILHFQDWQAVLGMIFGAVTGRPLFERTAEHFGEIRASVARAMHRPETLEGTLRAASRTFWRSAAAEFRQKTKTAEGPLRFVKVEIPKQVRALFIQALNRDVEFIRAGIRKRIDTQTWFASQKSREPLHSSSHERICRILEELKAKSRAGASSTASLLACMNFLKELAALKHRAERKSRMASRLESGALCRMSAYDVLTLMFSSVVQAMSCSEWNDRVEESAGTARRTTEESCKITAVNHASLETRGRQDHPLQPATTGPPPMRPKAVAGLQTSSTRKAV